MEIPTSAEVTQLHKTLPENAEDPRLLVCAAEKRQRLRDWMAGQGLDGVILSRRDNFAWLTAGGDSHVLSNSEAGVGHLVLTGNKQYLVAYSMDAQRLLDEQTRGQGYELVELRWRQGDPRLKAMGLAGRRIAADTTLEGALEKNKEIGYLHFPLHELEISRIRWLARRTGEILVHMAGWVQPGMSEIQIAREMKNAFTQDGIDLDVLIVGSDERVIKYRHPLPTQKQMERYVLLHPAARRWGLHANVSRSVHFGPPSQVVKDAYQAAATIEGRVLSMLKPGLKFSEILEHQKDWYSFLGFPGEWEFHFQGGPTAYQVADPARCLTDTAVEVNQAFDWFITVTGAKVEELALLTAAGIELASFSTGWPGIQVSTSTGMITLPDLYIR
jgi:Xaa-Pro dipeptidase